MAVHRQDAGVRRVVGRLARRPRPPRGLPGARRPGRAAAGADVLRHPRLARRPGGQLLAAGPRRPAGTLTYVEEPDLIHVYPLLPFVPEARPGLAADAGVPAVKISARAVRRARPAHGVRRLEAAPGRLRGRAGGAYPDLDGRDLDARDPARACWRTTTARCWAAPGCSTTGDAWRIGRVALHRDRPRPGLADRLMQAALAGLPGPRRRARRAVTAGRVVRRLRLRGRPARSSSRTASRTCRWGGAAQ